MDPELEKLVESGKLTSKAAEQLEKLRPGTFCLHKSWGFGRVREWNLLLNQIEIDFASKKSHAMQVQYAAENLKPLAPEHFLARKATDVAAIKNLAREDPVAVVRNIVESLDGKATTQQIGEWLIGDVFTEAEWKRWWESTKKALKASGAFSIPAKKTEPIQIRGEGVSHAEELIAAFNKARQPKEQIGAFEQIIKFHEQFKEPEKQLQPIIVAIENTAVRNQKMHPELAFEFIIARDDLLGRVPSSHDPYRFDPFKANSRGRKPFDINPAQIAGGKREKNLASAAVGAWSALDGARLKLDARQSRPHGRTNSAPLKRSRPACRASDSAGTKHSRTFGHERDVRLVM